MSQTDNAMISLADNEALEHFHKAVVEELLKLGPHPRKPLNVRKAAQVAGISENTAGKYVDILALTKKLEVVSNPPRKDLYLPDYSNGSEGEGLE